DRMLKEKGLRLHAAIELKVDEGILHQRIAKRVADMLASGKTIRADDNPEALEKRVHAYRLQTAPLVSYYKNHGLLRSTDGMASIDEVSAAIDRILGKAGQAETPARRAARTRKAIGKAAKAPKAKARKGRAAARKRPAKAVARRAPAGRRKAAKTRRKPINKAGRRG